VVWNFTNRCNLKCRHCYQGAGRPLPDELNLSQRLDIVRQLADQDVFSIAFSGGEPLMDAGLWEVLGAAHRQGLYVSIATNGTLLTETVVQRISAAGVNYVEISLDSVHPEVHDRFRGIPGLWKRTVTGIRNAVAAGVFSVGIASTITQLNYQEVEDLISFARDLGADKFYAFNFIPTGRGKGLIGIDLSPRQREQVLEILWQHYLEGDITCMTTAPQFARVCLVRSHAEMAPTSHYTVAKGKKAATVAEFVGGCGVGRAYCAIQPNGVVSPCVFMPIPVGDLRTTPFTEIWNHSPELNDLRERTDLKDHCGSCAYRSSCGGCRARAYAYFHDFKAPDPGCINNQSAYDQLLGEAAESAVRVSTVE